MGLAQSVLYFGIPAALFSASVLGLLPWIMRRGVAPFVMLNVTFCVPFALMFAVALVAVRLEGRAGSWAAIRRRMRLEPMPASAWAWTAALRGFSLLPFSLVAWMQPWAWVANGTLWAAFHIFYHATLFSFVAMLPGTLALVCQRTRSTWPGIIGHTVMNAAIPVMLLRGIAS